MAAKEKGKFGHLVGPEVEEEDGEDGADGEDGKDGEEEGEDGYDLKQCAHDIMAAVQAGDVDALEEALEELLEKHGE